MFGNKVFRYYSFEILWFTFVRDKNNTVFKITLKPKFSKILRTVWPCALSRTTYASQAALWLLSLWKLKSKWSFQNCKNTTVLDKPWYSKLRFTQYKQTDFGFLYHSIIQYYIVFLQNCKNTKIPNRASWFWETLFGYNIVNHGIRQKLVML